VHDARVSIREALGGVIIEAPSPPGGARRPPLPSVLVFSSADPWHASTAESVMLDAGTIVSVSGRRRCSRAQPAPCRGLHGAGLRPGRLLRAGGAGRSHIMRPSRYVSSAPRPSSAIYTPWSVRSAIASPPARLPNPFEALPAVS